MEVNFDLGTIFDTNFVRLDRVALRKWKYATCSRYFCARSNASIHCSPRRYAVVQSLIDSIGLLSSQAQNIRKGQLTSYDKLLDSDQEQLLYLYWLHHPEKPSVAGGRRRVR